MYMTAEFPLTKRKYSGAWADSVVDGRSYGGGWATTQRMPGGNKYLPTSERRPISARGGFRSSRSGQVK